LPGVSEEAINNLYQGGAKQIVDDLKKIIELLGIEGATSPFDRIVEVVQRALKQRLDA
jgi:hypothetical protein